MTTVIPFLPSNLIAPEFRATYDGNDYRNVITWNVSAQRYYLNIYDLNNSWIITVPLVQSPPSRATASVNYDNLRRVITVKMVDPSQWPLPLSTAGLLTSPGTVVDYTLENFDPTVLNTTWRTLQVDPVTFSFSLASDPGGINILGTVARYMNMIGGIFQTSTLIYRNGAFEVTP